MSSSRVRLRIRHFAVLTTLFSTLFALSAGAGMAARYSAEPEAGPQTGTHMLVASSRASRNYATRNSANAASPYTRRVLKVRTPHPAGTVIIDTNRRFLYLVQEGGTAIRYGIGVGRPGFEWAGTHRITRKAEWPDWHPPAEMRARQPYLPAFMPGGPKNPLGARALYLGSTLYRIHGTNEAQTIGQAVSSGCIRMLNEDVMHLYEQVDVGTKVIVF